MEDTPQTIDVAPRSRRRALVVIAIVAAALALCCVGTIVTAVFLLNRDGSGDIGDTMRDGRFEFTVTKVQCGQQRVGDEVLSTTPDGQFCVVTLTVKNVGPDAWAFSDIDQKAYTTDDRSFSSDFEAGIYANRTNEAEDVLSPGQQIQKVIVFDIPSSATLDRLELHDETFSTGVAVQVT